MCLQNAPAKEVADKAATAEARRKREVDADTLATPVAELLDIRGGGDLLLLEAHGSASRVDL